MIIYRPHQGMLGFMRLVSLEVVEDEARIQNSEFHPDWVGQSVAAFRDQAGHVWHQDPHFAPLPVSMLGIGTRWRPVHFWREAQGVDGIEIERLNR